LLIRKLILKIFMHSDLHVMKRYILRIILSCSHYGNDNVDSYKLEEIHLVDF